MVKLFMVREKVNRLLVAINQLCAGSPAILEFGPAMKRKLRVLAVLLLALWFSALLSILLATFFCFRGIAAKKVNT